MKKHFLDRLVRLADFLDALPKQKFDFATVVSEGGKPMMEALKAGKTECGTVACAIGWMPAAFPRDVKWSRSSVGDIWGVELREHGASGNFQAAERYFGITSVESSYLFSPDAYNNH